MHLDEARSEAYYTPFAVSSFHATRCI